MEARYWLGTVPKTDDFGNPIQSEFIDGKSRQGPWGFFTPRAWAAYGIGALGVGRGQRYAKQSDGRFKKEEG